MDASDVALRIETFIRETFQIAPDDPGFGRSIDLFETGYVDSVGVIETLAFITESFGVEVPDEALLSNEFASIDGMAQVVVGLANTAASPHKSRPAA
jgi:acyl carrier protein